MVKNRNEEESIQTSKGGELGWGRPSTGPAVLEPQCLDSRREGSRNRGAAGRAQSCWMKRDLRNAFVGSPHRN